MDQGWRQYLRRASCAALGLAFAAGAGAAPPSLNSTLNGLRAGPRLAVGRPAPSRLDLRAPVDLTATPPKPLAVAAGDAPFPSLRRPANDPSRSREEQAGPSLGSDGIAMARPMSRAQEITRRFQREGLPVARLFESHSALVSLGLNQHGKPGIWLIQKLP